MLFKYFDNYFSKVAIIDYEKDEIKKFISKYYITDIQSQNQVLTFVDNFLYLYKIVSGIYFSFENKYKFDLKKCDLFNSKKAQKIKFKKFYKNFDIIMENDTNVKTLMFLLEILEPEKYISDKKNIINYISIFELLLVKGDKDISSQIQNKCAEIMENYNYTKE